MNSSEAFGQELARLFRRDLHRLLYQIESFPNDESLWRTLPGIANSAGNLALHIEGNLREYVGRQLGHLSYVRDRPLEFSAKCISRTELSARMGELARVIPSVIEGLSLEEMNREFPEVVLAQPMPTREFLVHLYGHLNWHMGQIDYLRRIIAGTEGGK